MFPNFVLLLFVNPQEEVLLLRRINTPFSNLCYSLPGGKIELGESATQAAIREAKNSLGVDITPEDLEFVHIMSRKCNDPEFFACVFKVRNYQGTLENKEPERHDDLRWFSVNALPKNIVGAHEHALHMVQNNILYSEHGWR